MGPMTLRLPQILALMGLILLAGVLSVRHLEGRVGASTVPGAIVLDALGIGPGEVAGLLRRWVLARPVWVAAGPAPGEPFGEALARRRAAHGAAVVRFDLVRSPGGPPSERAGREAWPVQIDPATDVDGRLLTDDSAFERALEALAGFVEGPIGVRPFLAVVDGGPGVGAGQVDAFLARVADAATRLPSYRATAIVVLGRREPESGRRYALRLDIGREVPLPVGAPFADLLEAAW